MERLDWKKTIRVNIIMMRILGLWPKDDESYGRNFYTLYTTLVIILQVSHISFESINLYLIMDDLKAVTGSIFVLIEEILTIIKVYFLIKNMGMLKQLMITVNSDLFQPKTPHQRNLVQPNLDTWTTMVLAHRTFAVGWLFVWCCIPFFDKTYQKQRLPFLAWYPHDTKTSPNYELTYLYQVVCISYICMTNININWLIAALNMYIGSQFDLLGDDLRNLHQTAEEEEVYQKVKNCIHHHREILKFANYANKFYNWLLLVQFVLGGIVIGLSMFQLTVVVPFSGEFYSYFSYTNAISLEVFMYCWFGNEIELKSGKLPYAVFESDWTDFSSEVKVCLVIFLLRLQRSLQISALGLVNLSLSTFMKIMRTAWSYFALLRQVNARKLQISDI